MRLTDCIASPENLKGQLSSVSRLGATAVQRYVAPTHLLVLTAVCKLVVTKGTQPLSHAICGDIFVKSVLPERPLDARPRQVRHPCGRCVMDLIPRHQVLLVETRMGRQQLHPPGQPKRQPSHRCSTHQAASRLSTKELKPQLKRSLWLRRGFWLQSKVRSEKNLHLFTAVCVCVLLDPCSL